MYRDAVEKHIKRLKHEIKQYKDIQNHNDIETLLGCALIDIDDQREQLTSLMSDLIRVYNIEPELRHEIAEFITESLRDNRDLEILITRIADHLKKKTKKAK